MDDDEATATSFSVVPRGKVKIVRNARGQEREKIQLKLRACLSCKLVMSEQQFYNEGCPNCQVLQMDGDRHKVFDMTTANFQGLIALMNPERSWVGRYNKLVDVVPGCYASQVVGELPESVRDDIHRMKHQGGRR
eukprot:GHVS01098362.1.p1 GENE.GHVS01098362.1~~GHVS01098362.1.p1  ORF type:complete len:135 (+),score=20.77 GHVS01098362.1:167-571(+)